jgi:phospholipid/cholesterol/gamma-HCH transport system substrate-binding protein
MPSAKKVKWAQLRVGIMAIVAMVILGILIFLLTGSKALFAKRAVIYTYLSDSASLATGAPVRLNGIVVGDVAKVELSGLKDPRKVVRVAMSVTYDKLAKIPEDSEAAISAENVLGTKFINITMGRSPITIKDGGTLPAKDTTEFEEVIQSGYDALTAARGLLKRIDALVGEIESGKGSLGKFLVDDEFYNRLTATVNETLKIAQAVNSGRGTIGRLVYDERLYEEVRGSIQRLDSIMENVEQGQGTVGKLLRDPALYDDARRTVAELRRLAEDLNAGKGTAGKFLKDEQLYREVNQTIAKLETILNRINTGEGTIGQLLVNPSLYDSLDGATQELHGLMKDFRANPKKFLRIKLSIF